MGTTAVLLLLLILPSALHACSYVEINVQGGGHGEKLHAQRVIARTMELGGVNQWEATMYPREAVHHPFVARGHGFLALDAVHQFRIPIEGMNEFGLAVSGHTLTSSVYQPKPSASQSDVTVLSYLAVVSHLLRTASTVPQALAALRDCAVVAEPAVAIDFGHGLHWSISDQTSASVVVEYLRGVMTVWNNSVGVMTNDPPFDWHLLNLNTHVNLQCGWPSSNNDIQMDSSEGLLPRVIGHGFNLKGLPGDPSPPSRFIRLFYLRQYAQATLRVTSIDDAIVLATGLINNVHIIRGTVARENALSGFEFVPFAVLKIPAELKFMFRSYSDMQWKLVELNQLNFSSGTAPVTLPLGSELNIKDITADFQNLSG